MSSKINSFLKEDFQVKIEMILTSNDRFWPLRSSAVTASAGASVFTSSDIFIRFFGIGFELTNFRRRSLNWKDFDLSAKEPILILLARGFRLVCCNWSTEFCKIKRSICRIITFLSTLNYFWYLRVGIAKKFLQFLND